METKQERKPKFMSMSVKAIDDNGTIEGYGNTFGNIDSYGDVVVKGAFEKTLKDRGAKTKLLWQHDSTQPIGVWEQLSEDNVGLKVRGKLLINKGVAKADEAYALLKAGALDGLSIGFIPMQADLDAKTGINYIREVKLYEVSLVTFPANEASTITSIRSEFESLESAFDSLDEEKRIKTLTFINNLKQSPLVSTEQPPTVEASTGNTAKDSEPEEHKDNKPQSPDEEDLHLLEQLVEAIKQLKKGIRQEK